MSIDMKTYLALSAVMFLEYAVWGAWAPVLAARLLGPLKFSGKQTGWIYATLPIACMISPLVSGQLADKWFNLEYILVVTHLVGAVLLFAAARCEKFSPLFLVMMLYSLCYAATLPLVNAVLFAKVTDIDTQGKVFIWAPVAWALVGYFLTSWRWVYKTEVRGRDCLFLAAALSVVMAAVCLMLPASPPAGEGGTPILKAVSLLGQSNFLIFFIVSVVIAGLMQFYFLGSARFMQDIGINGKNVPAAMGIAQAVQAVATFFALGFFLSDVGFKNTLLIGACCWFLLYLIYTTTRVRWLVVMGQGLHGLAYVLFIIVGQIFANTVADPEIRGSTQGLIFFATTGLGLFLGTQAAGIVMDRFSVEGQFRWRKVWMVPLIVLVIGIIFLLTMFHNPQTAA
ncbi:MAG: MFS transporter [Planctomycetes bacterium]|nr:MFS transporter [Planctomycetota bacterium]